MQSGIINKGELVQSAARRGSQYLLVRLARKTQATQKALARQAYNVSSEQMRDWLKEYKHQCKLLVTPVQMKTPKRHFKTHYDEDELLQYTIPWREDNEKFFSVNKSDPKMTKLTKLNKIDTNLKEIKEISTSKRQNSVESPRRTRPRQDTLSERRRNPQRRLLTVMEPVIDLTADRLDRFMRHLHALLLPEYPYDSDRSIDHTRLSELISQEYLINQDVLSGKKLLPFKTVTVPFACFLSSKQTKKSIHYMINMPLRYALRLCFDLYDKDGDGYIGNQDALQLIYLSSSKPALGGDAVKIASAISNGEVSSYRTPSQDSKNGSLKFDPQRLFTLLKEDQRGTRGDKHNHLSFHAFSELFKTKPNGFYDVIQLLFGLNQEDLGGYPEGCIWTNTPKVPPQEDSLEQRWDKKQQSLTTIRQEKKWRLPVLSL